MTDYNNQLSFGSLFIYQDQTLGLEPYYVKDLEIVSALYIGLYFWDLSRPY